MSVAGHFHHLVLESSLTAAGSHVVETGKSTSDSTSRSFSLSGNQSFRHSSRKETDSRHPVANDVSPSASARRCAQSCDLSAASVLLTIGKGNQYDCLLFPFARCFAPNCIALPLTGDYTISRHLLPQGDPSNPNKRWDLCPLQGDLPSTRRRNRCQQPPLEE